jgi:nifR3 family TIM-barrel protein
MTTGAPALHIGTIDVSPPVVLAPMAGITNPAYRRLCRRFGAGLFVSEMITARGLVEGGARSWDMAAFDPDESPRSIQLYGTDPDVMGEAVRRLVGEGRVDHVDLNLGCPARKVTRHGGGAALTARPRLLARVVGAAVNAAQDASPDPGRPVPVTIKFRLGIDDDELTYLDAGRIGEDAGCAAVALHARTAAQLYSGHADWSAIARLREHVTSIPVLGNGDIWSADDAVHMMSETGCDGVVIGRACLGRPWLFRDLVDVFDGRPASPAPRLGPVVDTMVEHLGLLVERMGVSRALRDFRKHVGWYLAGYAVGAAPRRTLTTSASHDEVRAVLAGLDPTLRIDPALEHAPRGTQRGPQVVALPDRWLAERYSDQPPGRDADLVTSGG